MPSKKLQISGEYRLKNIHEFSEMFPNLIELKLFDFQIECKFSQTEYVCFECIYNQIKDLVVLTHYLKLKTLEVHFWKDMDFSLHYRMIIKAIFETIIDCNQSLKINLQSKEEEIKTNCFIDLI